MSIPFLSNVALASSMFSLGLAARVLVQNMRRTENISFAAGMTTLSVIAFSHFMDYYSYDPEIWREIAFAGQIFLPVPWVAFSIVFARTDPASHLRKWRAAIGGISFVALVFLVMFLYSSYDSDVLDFETTRYWTAIFLMLALTLILANFEVTMRSGEHRQRWRIKFLVIGISSIFFFMIFNFSYLVLFPKSKYDFSHIFPTVIFIGSFLAALSLVRHSLLDVDIAVSRDIVKNSFILLMVGGYLISVGIIAQAIRTFGGDFSLYLQFVFVFLSLIFIGLVLFSTHARKTAKMFMDKHFFKSKFDYGKEWLRLNDRLSSKLDIDDLAETLANLFQEIFWIDTTILWLFDERMEDFRIVYPGDNQPAGLILGNPALLRLMMNEDRPVLLDDLQDRADLSEDGRKQTDLLKRREISLLVPLKIETKPVGALGFSKSRYGVPFDSEDLALIDTIARQAASAFLGAQLVERVALSKELETFHLFSSFIIHDLKNFVSMLSLVVQNMEKNFSNPAFQKDAMASLSGIVEKMERMMVRLSVLSAAPIPCKVQTDLNELLRELMEEMKGTVRSRMAAAWRDLPRVWVDPEQMMTVIRNLVRNADESTKNGGEIRLSTEVEDGKVLVTVSDNGCGIPREYLEGELFTLFSTTKSDGFGIGLYQAKRIVESHGGRIEAESEVGKGSTFRIRLPVSEG